MQTALDASPQFAEDALHERLIDRIGYDDEARGAALARAGSGAKAIKMTDYLRARSDRIPSPPANIAVIEAAGEIPDGTARPSLLGSDDGIASDDLSDAIRRAARDPGIKAIVLRVDLPGGSVSASDQILHAVKTAQASRQAGGGEHGGGGGFGRLLHRHQRQPHRRRTGHDHRLDRRVDRQGFLRQIARPGWGGRGRSLGGEKHS